MLEYLTIVALKNMSIPIQSSNALEYKVSLSVTI